MSSITLEQRKATYEAAHAAFKRHEACGWHLVARSETTSQGRSATVVPFMVDAEDPMDGLSPMEEQENATIQEAIDTYDALHAELKRAKKAYKKAKAKAKPQVAKAQVAKVVEPDTIPITTEEVEEYVENRFPTVTAVEFYSVWRPYEPEYEVCEPDIIELTHDEVADYVESRFTITPTLSISFPCLTYAQAHKLFNHFKMNVDGTCSFQIAKDGACYDDMLLPCHKAVTVATLRVYAAALQLKGRGSMRKAELLQVLTPIMDEITTYSAW